LERVILVVLHHVGGRHLRVIEVYPVTRIIAFQF
jgi:hypothetical protein